VISDINLTDIFFSAQDTTPDMAGRHRQSDSWPPG
jgi:hypothetical protein